MAEKVHCKENGSLRPRGGGTVWRGSSSNPGKGGEGENDPLDGFSTPRVPKETAVPGEKPS